MSDLEQSHLKKAPLFRRLWFVVVLTCSLILMPVALIILLTGKVYRKQLDGWQPISNKARYIYGSLLVLWLVAATAKLLLQPGGVKGEWDRSADTTTSQPGGAAPSTAQQTAAAKDEGGLDSCTSDSTIETVKSIISEMHQENGQPFEVVDFGKAGETWMDKAKGVRRCHAEAALNAGNTIVTYQLLRGPSGKQLVQAQIGPTAATQYEVDKGLKEEAEAEALAAVKKEMAAKEQVSADSSQGNAGMESDSDVRDDYSETYVSCMTSGNAAKGVSSAMKSCIDAEIDLQNSRMKDKFQGRMASLSDDAAQTYRSNEMAWGEKMTSGCATLRNSGDPVAEPHCVLNNTIRHFKRM